MDQRSEAIKFLEENIEGKLVDIFFGSGFLWIYHQKQKH